MTKEDYMRLPKERLAELLAEWDIKFEIITHSIHQPVYKQDIPCYAEGGWCPNPYHDCINCPKQFGGGGYTTTSELQPNT